MQSIWQLTNNIAPRAPLDGDISVDTAVIGAGMAGILTAYFLHKSGKDVIVLEADRIGSGMTGNTTAKITSQHRLIYDQLIQNFGEEKARQYAQANQSAIQQYAQLVKELKIDCDFEQIPAYVYSRANRDSIEKEVQAAQRLDIPAELLVPSNLPFPVEAAVMFPHQAQFNPIAFLAAVSQPLTVYEQTFARAVEGNVITTNRGRVSAKNIVMATHFPFLNAPGYYFVRMYQQRSYVVALEHAPDLRGMYLDAAEDGLSFRNYQNLLLLGGSSHRTGKNHLGNCYEKLHRTAAKLYPESKVKYQWSAQDCMSLDQVPYIGKFSNSTPNLFVATGFNKWGMTSSMVAASILSQMILKQPCPYQEVFSPQRFSAPASAANLVKNTAEAVKGISSELLKIPEADLSKLPLGHGGVVEVNGIKAGVYKDPEGNCFVVSTKCPHLGCMLEWNPDELTWDCPCHGSRFDYRGNLIQNPALKGLDKAE